LWDKNVFIINPFSESHEQLEELWGLRILGGLGLKKVENHCFKCDSEVTIISRHFKYCLNIIIIMFLIKLFPGYTVLGHHQLCCFSYVLMTIHIYFSVSLLWYKQKIQEICTQNVKKKILNKMVSLSKNQYLVSVRNFPSDFESFLGLSVLSVPFRFKRARVLLLLKCKGRSQSI